MAWGVFILGAQIELFRPRAARRPVESTREDSNGIYRGRTWDFIREAQRWAYSQDSPTMGIPAGTAGIIMDARGSRERPWGYPLARASAVFSTAAHEFPRTKLGCHRCQRERQRAPAGAGEIPWARPRATANKKDNANSLLSQMLTIYLPIQGRCRCKLAGNFTTYIDLRATRIASLCRRFCR